MISLSDSGSASTSDRDCYKATKKYHPSKLSLSYNLRDKHAGTNKRTTMRGIAEESRATLGFLRQERIGTRM